nr:unnamed protein product [Callosobruchus analis]
MPWFHEMHSFLGDTGDYRESVSSELNTESSQDSQTSDSVSGPLTPQSVVSSPLPSPTIEDRSHPESANNVTTPHRKRKLEEPITQALNRLENLSSAINRHAVYDEFHYFAQNVAAQLRTLPLYEALDVQTEVQAFLTSARRRQ